MRMGNYGGQGGGMPSYQQMSSYPQGPSGKGGASPYGSFQQRIPPSGPYGGGKGGSRGMPYNAYPGQNTTQPFMPQAGSASAGQIGGNPNKTMNQQQSQPANPFAENAEYKALMDFQKTLGPTEEQQKRLQELQSAFEGTGAFKDYRIQQLENQQREMQRMAQMAMQRRNPYDMGGIGAFRGQFGPPVQREFGGFAPFPQQYMPQQMYSPMYNLMYKEGGKVSR